MKLTRDSMGLTIAVIASVAVFLSGHFELLTKAIPGLGMEWQARIELLAALTGIVSGVLRMSPLALSRGNEMATRDHDTTLTVVASKPKE